MNERIEDWEIMGIFASRVLSIGQALWGPLRGNQGLVSADDWGIQGASRGSVEGPVGTIGENGRLYVIDIHHYLGQCFVCGPPLSCYH